MKLSVAFTLLPALLLSIGATAARADDPPENAPSPPAADGWETPFNGRDFAGWRGRKETPGAGWVVEEGAMVRKKGAGDLFFAEPVGDFILELEFLTKGNSGVLFRKADVESAAKDRLEIQIQPPAKSPNKHSCGALYDCLAPTKEMCRKDEWNQLRLTSADNRVEVVINGEQVIDANLEDWTESGKNPDGSANKFSPALREFSRVGYFGFQDHGAEVRFRNLRLKRLPTPLQEAPR